MIERRAKPWAELSIDAAGEGAVAAMLRMVTRYLRFEDSR
jgi:hypothetical protein